jgi:HPt (histidine-containing phosphotransfer) domain-containing protein
VAELIDRAHLARMTMEDKKVEAEVLRLFDRQCAMLVECIRDALPEAAAAFAHAFKGSCRGVGAWHMAQAAEQLETAARACDRQGLDASLGHLADAVVQMRAAISHLLYGQS